MTFAELQQALNDLRFQRAIVTHLMEHLDGEFMPSLDEKPKKVILTDDKVRVPQETFDTVLSSLAAWCAHLKKQEAGYLEANLAVVPPAGQPGPVEGKMPATLTVEPVQVEPPPEPEDEPQQEQPTPPQEEAQS